MLINSPKRSEIARFCSELVCRQLTSLTQQLTPAAHPTHEYGPLIAATCGYIEIKRVPSLGGHCDQTVIDIAKS